MSVVNNNKVAMTTDENKSAAKSPKDDFKDVSFIQMLKYADGLDIFLMIIGIIAALASAVIQPLSFLLYGNVATILVNSQIAAKLSSYSTTSSTASTATTTTTQSNSTTSISSCYSVSSISTTTNYSDQLNQNITYYVIIAFVSLFLNYVLNVTWNTSAERQCKRIRNILFEQILRQEMAFFDRNTPGDLNSRVTANVNAINVAIGYKFPDTISLLGKGLGCTIFGIYSAWSFALVFLAVVPFMSLFSYLMVFMIKKYTVLQFSAYGKAGSIAQEILSSLRTVVALGIQKDQIEIYTKNLDDAAQTTIKKGFYTGLFAGLTTFLSNAMFGIGLYYGVYLVSSDCVTYPVGNIMQSFFSIFTTSFVIGQALGYFNDLAQAQGAAKNVFGIINKQSEIDALSSKKGKLVEKCDGAIEFENIFFNYPQRADAKILQGLTLSIPAGKTVALCGSSGGGKSTVIQLLQRFYNPLSGVVKLDGNDIKELDLVSLRNQMALVSQEPVLFAISILENIRLGRLDATNEECMEAAKQANAHNFIMSLKDAYDTLVGERGTQMSGGQKQRIAIARALVRNPKILLLDEATSALDLESEKVVQEALDKAKVGRTTIIIAHRLSTIRNADLIVGISGGVVGEVGTHDELMKKQGIYYDLVQRQTNQEEKEKKKKIGNEVLSDNDFAGTFNRAASARSKASIASNSSNSNPEEKEKYGFYQVESKIWKLNRPEGFYIFLGAFSQLVQGCVFPGIVVLFTQIYTIFQEPDKAKQTSESLTYLGYMMGIAGLAFFVNLLSSYSFSVANAKLTKRVRKEMLTSMIRQEMAWHDQEENRSSVLATRLAVNAPLCSGITNEFLSGLCNGLGGLGVAAIISLYTCWQLALVMFCFVPISFGGGLIAGRSSTNTNVGGKTSVEEGGRIVTECVENIKTVVSLGRELFFLNDFKKQFENKYKLSLILLHVQAFFYSFSNSLIFFVQTVAFSYGYYLINNAGLSVTGLYRVYASVTFASLILGRVFAQIPDQKKSKDAAISSLDIINRKSKIDSMSEEGLKPNTMIGEIKFEKVHFKYPTRPNKILKGLNLTIKPNETTALVGQSGCGKSTTIQLLMRFYDIKKGAITLDGINIKDLNIQWLRSQIGLVSQEPVLFNYSIKSNIMFGDIERNDIKIEEIMSVSREANIAQRIENLPDQYETIVGTKGGQLSGGEKQRVAIARALVRKPKLLLLDEATSALDSQSEQIVQDALDKAQIGRTCICIAHRLSTIQNAAKISVFKEGKILEEGKHSELMSNKNVYYGLQMQNQANA